ncbi:MAG: DciA family protein [Acidobacteriota bacterium]
MSQRFSSFRPSIPDVPSVTRALEQSETLFSLMQRLQASQACLSVVKACLPPALAAHVKSGSFDHEGWTLLAPNAAVSAKLRQLQPRLIEALAKQDLKVNAIRVKVQSYDQG